MNSIPTAFDPLGSSEGLPFGYTRLFAAQSDGEAYIDTLITPSSEAETRWAIDIDTSAFAANSEIGTVRTNASRFGWRVAATGNACTAHADGVEYVSDVLKDNLSVYTFDIDLLAKQASISREGALMWSNSVPYSVSRNATTRIFFPGRQSEQGTPQYVGSVAVCQSLIWEHGVLVQHLVPVKNRTGSCVFFDLISRTDFMPATGTFTEYSH